MRITTHAYNTFLVNYVMFLLSIHDSEVNHGGQKKNDQEESGEKNREEKNCKA